jgi:hypothetical protein
MDDGAQAVWRQDGKYLLLLATSTVTNVIDPGAGNQNPVFTSSGTPSMQGNVGYGITAFMLPDGRYFKYKRFRT